MAQLPRYQSSGIAVATPQGQFRDVSAPFDQLSAQMDKMTSFYIQQAKVEAVAQAEEYAADKAPTIQQIEEARLYNKPLEPIADKTTIFGRAANEAQSRILAKNVAAAADIQMAQIQQDVSSGKVKVNDIIGQTNALIKGYSSALAEVDPMVARSVEADLALSGNKLFVSATKAAAADALEKQNQTILEANKIGLTSGIMQILSAGPVVVDDMGKKLKVDESAQISLLIEKAKSRADSLPASKRKAAYKDIQSSLKEGAERYGQEIVIKGGLGDLKVLDAQIRSGKFDFAITDPKDRITLLSTVESRINHLESVPKKITTAQKKIVTDEFNNANSRFGIGNYDISRLPSQDDLNSIYADDPVELDQKTKERSALISTSQVASEVKYKTKAERDALVEAARLAGQDTDTVARFKLLQSVNESVDREFKNDPAKASLKFAEVNTAYENVLELKKQQAENPSKDTSFLDKSIAEYAAVSQQRQIENGVLPGDVHYFPKEWVESYKDVFTNQIKSGVNAADFFMNEANFWGPMWPSLVKEMKLGTEMLVISNMSSTLETRRGAQTLANALVNKKDLMNTFSSEKSKIEKSIEPRMAELSKSLRFKTDSASIYNSVFDSTTLLAMAYMSNGEAASISDASDKAFQMVVGNAYHFSDGYRIPKTLGPNYSTDLIQFNAELIRSNIDHFKDELEIPVSLTAKSQNITSEQEKDIYIDSISAHGLWINTGDDSFGLRLVDQHGRPVRYKNGMPIELSWTTLNNKGYTDLMEVSDASGIFTMVPAELQGATPETNTYNIEKKKLLDSYGIKSK